MDIILYIALLVISCSVIVFLFNYRNRQMQKLYAAKISKLKRAVMLHKNQIFQRSESISKYDMQSYNIAEVLIKQLHINIDV